MSFAINQNASSSQLPAPTGAELFSHLEQFAARRRTDGMNTMPEKVFDDLAWLAAQVCCTPIAVVSVAGSNGQQIKAKVGLTAQEAGRDLMDCTAPVSQTSLMLVADATQDARLAQHTLVVNSPKLRFFASMPLISAGGVNLGVLSVMDRVPRQLSPEQVYALEVLARQLVGQLEGASARAM